MAHPQEALVGRYELRDVIGRGGMGIVYRATDRVLGRRVAVKVLPAVLAEDPKFVGRFEREALAAASLSHPNIVVVYDSGQDSATRFIVMEYVQGESLAQLVRRRGALAPREAAVIASQAASALAAAHRAGIVHRDVKPANLMLDTAGTVKVLDFGIARAAAAASLTQTATVLGSAPYLAPEVTQGRVADARSDVYSLGCVLYELLAGRPPFTGEAPAAILHQHNTTPPPALREVAVDVPAGLDALTLQMLAKDPNARPQDAQLLVSALPASLNDQTAATSPVAAPRIHRTWRRSTLAVGIAALVLVIGLAVAIAASSGGGPARRAGSPAATKPARTSAATTAAPARTPPPPAGTQPAATVTPGPQGKHGRAAGVRKRGAPDGGRDGPPGHAKGHGPHR